MLQKGSLSFVRSYLSLFSLLALSLVLPVVVGCSNPPPLSVSVTAAASSVDGSDSVGLTAAVANDKNAAGVTWTLSGAGALSSNTVSSVTYTAPAATSSSQTITITATSNADPTKTGSATVTVPAMPTVTTSSLAAATVGTAYTTTLAGSGGISPYKWSLKSGTLPASMSLTAAGVLSGTAMATDAGSYNLTVQLTDSGTATPLTATKALTLTINAAPAIQFTTTSLVQGVYNQAYTATVAATGGAGTLTYSLASGPLPTGLTLSPAGLIAGTPTVAGTFPIMVKAADAFGDSATQSLSLKVVYPALTVTTNSLPTGYVGTNYSQQLSASGGSGAGYSWAMATGSALPAGLTLSSGGLISGKPTTAATTSFTVVVTDSGTNTANGNLSITVNPGVTISTGTSLPTGYVGSSYSQQLAATGGTGTGYVWTVSSGSSLPAGLTLSSSGLLSGKPTASGTPSFGITVTDSASNTASATFSMTISPGVTITTTSLPSGYQGGVYSGATMSATGGSGTGYSWTWAAASGSSLPAGLVLSSGGAISGTPTASGTFNIIFTVADSANNTASTTLALTVEASLSVTTTTLPSGTVGVAYSQQLAATGGSGSYSWSTNAAGTTSLAGIGLSLASTGVVSGATPTAGTATFSATVTDSASHTTSATVSVTVYSGLTVTTTTLPSTNAGVAYSQQLAAAGGTGTGETWTVTAGSASLTAVGLSVSSSGVVSGTAPIQGTASFTVQVTDSGSHTATQALSVTVYSALSLPPPNPSSLPSTGTTGVFYSGTITASGGSGNYSWAVSGLSDGLSSSAAGGTLTVSGTPTAAATVTFNVVLTDTTTSNSITVLSYMVVVSNPQPLLLPSPNPSSLPAATVSQAYVGSIQATGGVGPYTWKINGTPVTGTPLALSNGLSATSTGGTTLSIGGTPTTTTSVSLTSVTVTDSEATPVTAGPDTYTIAVNSAGQNVGGQITMANSCGSSSSVPPVSVTISNGSFTATTTTDGSGNYSFSNVPNGTYTITPSITGPSSVFLPATLTGVVVNNANVIGENFGVSLGYTVSGTVSYSGTQSGRVYVELIGNCSEMDNGTSLTAAGAYTIHGVAPGTYTVQSWMDPSTLGEGSANDLDPVGNGSVTVTSANQSNINVTLVDPTQSIPTTSPSIKAISPTNNGVVISFGGGSVTDSTTGKELFTSYTVQWSTSQSSGFSTSDQATFKAIGIHQNVWIVDAADTSFKGALTNGTAYYFRVAGSNSAGMGPWRTSSTAVTIGAPSTGNTVSGAVTIPNNVTVAAGAILYVGYYDQSTNTAYAAAITSPVQGANNFTVMVPTGSNYIFFGILDQNHDGLIDAGDVTNVNSNNTPSASITGNMTGQNLTLSGSNSAAVARSYYFSNTTGSPSSYYGVVLQVSAAVKLPVSVTLVSGPNVQSPLDMSNYCQNCGNSAFLYATSISGVVPSAGQTYTFDVKYSDGTEDTAVTAQIAAVLGPNGLTTNLAPTGTSSTSVTPTFTWTYPSSASSYVYQFYLSDSSGNGIWQIPGFNSVANGFSSTQIPGTLTWGVDPTDSTNKPTVTQLTTGQTYYWQITTVDSNGDTATTQVNYQP